MNRKQFASALLSATAIFSLLLTACDEQDKLVTEWETGGWSSDITLSVTPPAATEFGDAGGSGTLTIGASDIWEATSDESWVSFIDPITGDEVSSVVSDTTALTFKVEAHTGENRTAYITITVGEKTTVITITQTGTIPGVAQLNGDPANVYPDTTVTLTAEIEGATSYIWLRDGVEFDTTNVRTYTLGLADTTIALTVADFRGQHSYTVRGHNIKGDGAISAPVVVTLTGLQDMPLFIAPTISGKSVNDRRDSLDRTVGITLTPTVVKGATKYIWNNGTSDVRTIDISIFPDSVLYGDEDGKGAKIDSIISYTATTSGNYTVRVGNNALGVEPASNPHEVTFNTYVFGWKDDITQALKGTWTAAVTSTPYDTLGVVKSTLISSYTLVIDSVDASTIKITTNFGVLDTAGVFTATIDLSNENISIASQKVAPAGTGKKFHTAYTPAYIATNKSNTPANNAGKGIKVTLGGNRSNPTLTLTDGYLLYRGDSSGAYLGHPIMHVPIATTAPATSVVWTKQP